MRWVEIINARIAASADATEVEQLFRAIRKNVTAGTGKRVRVVVYRSSMLDGDWAILLHRETDERPSGRTWLGIKLADEVRRVALVDHSVWIEED